jgi:hypothetical protein
MKNQISRLLIVGGFAAAFVAGAASRSIPATTAVTTVAAQEKHEAMKDVRTARDLMQQPEAFWRARLDRSAATGKRR